MKELFWIIWDMDMGFLEIKMANHLKENGEWAPKMGTEFGSHLMVVIIKENGIWICNMEKESLHIFQVIIRVNLKIGLKMV